MTAMQRMALGLSYDGSLWQGWQTQPARSGVQDAVQAALKQFLGHDCATVCAGRTDAGVHALAQVIHLDTPAQRPPHAWVRGLNALLPDSIAVQWVCPVADTFHARYSAQARSYLYLLRQAPVYSPLLRNQTGWVFQPLDVTAMQAALPAILGEHDFSSFRSSQCQATSPVRTLLAASIEQRGAFYRFHFTANAFLHHMVRNLMGALIYIGMGRQPPDWMQTLLTQRDRRLAAPTFAPNGLYLAGVLYDAAYGLPMPKVMDEAAVNTVWAQHWPG